MDPLEEKLNKALKDLEQTQTMLLHAEKMADLGELIAGISHELNTPTSVILMSIEEIDRDHAGLLKDMTYLIEKLPPPLQKQYLSVCNKVAGANHHLNTSEARSISSQIEAFLAENGVNNARPISKNLATVNLTKTDVEPLLELLKSSEGEKIYQTWFKIGMNQIHVGDIKLAIQRVVALVKAIRVYTHADYDEPTSIDLREEIENTLIILNHKLKYGIVVKKEIEDIPKIACYADQLNQVWTNVILNAVEAMHGKGEMVVRVRQENNDSIVVEIQDDGPGIEKEILPHIFERYFTTKPKEEGTGLGLSISKEIIDKHKGSISVETNPGKTVFKVKVPIAIQENKNI